MKPLKPRDKVTQRMTRDGLTLDNQTTGESVNVSSREAEQEYSAAEPGGAAEKVLERAGDIRDRRKAKRAAKDAGDVVTEAGEALHRPSSRLQFTAEERADPRLSKYIHKAEKMCIRDSSYSSVVVSPVSGSVTVRVPVRVSVR